MDMRRVAGAGLARAIERFVCNRPRRMLVLILGIITLSAADLAVTLSHLTTIGMLEANPIAAWLLRSTGSAWLLASYKALTVGVCVGLLYRLRHHRSGELAAWCAMAILVLMCFIWRDYAWYLAQPTNLDLAQAASAHPDWILLD
ncbi:MAG: DUF5658 family protein [Planctomycetota bacterium]|jgi:hypothetical protein